MLREEQKAKRKVLLPVFRLSELTEQDDPRAIKRIVKQSNGRPAVTYYYRFVSEENEQPGYNYNLLPVVLDTKSAPWVLGNLYILSELEGKIEPIMKTFYSLAVDLGAFKEWLDAQNNPDEVLFNFPRKKLTRTTYRFRGFLSRQIQAREIAPSTAKRRMGAVVAFYRWLIKNKFLRVEFPTWEEKDYQLSFKTNHGQQLSKKVSGTDLSISAPKAEDALDETIVDGGNLRPLTGAEQNWLLEAILAKSNSECLLMHLFMLGTGSRIESTCTLRLRHFTDSDPGYSKSLTGEGQVYRLNAGPGTGIETKYEKSGTSQIPRELYDLMHTYALSTRAAARRNKFTHKYGPHPDPYLFVTQQGNPYYVAKTEAKLFSSDVRRRYEMNGQAVRQFIKDHVIPYVRERYDSNFYYRPHDLRASFGMNMTEFLEKKIEEKNINRHEARMTIKDLLWHASVDTTDLYLNYKIKIDNYRAAINGYGEHLRQWTDRAMRGLDVI